MFASFCYVDDLRLGLLMSESKDMFQTEPLPKFRSGVSYANPV